MVMAMKLYIMLCPAIMGGSLIFSKDSPELNYMSKMLFLLGGAWATLKSGTVVTSLISAGAGADESQTANMTSGALFAAGGRVAGAATEVAFRGIGSAVGSKFSKARQNRNESQKAFDNTKFKSTGSSASGGGASGGSTSAAGTGTSGGGGTSAAGIGASDNGGTSAAGTGTSGGGTSGVAASSGASGSPKKFFADQKGGKQIASYPLGFKKYKMNDGSTRTGFNLGGKLLGVKRDEKGTKFQFMGMSIRRGNDGKISKVGILGMGTSKRGVDGKMHTAKLNIAGCKFRANSDDGKLQMTDINALGIHREQQENGEYRVTSALGGLYQQSFAKQEDGSLQTAGVRFMGMNLKLDEQAAEHNRNLNQ
jgi:hypothetical protein